jgi:hypothetical protein
MTCRSDSSSTRPRRTVTARVTRSNANLGDIWGRDCSHMRRCRNCPSSSTDSSSCMAQCTSSDGAGKHGMQPHTNTVRTSCLRRIKFRNKSEEERGSKKAMKTDQFRQHLVASQAATMTGVYMLLHSMSRDSRRLYMLSCSICKLWVWE